MFEVWESVVLDIDTWAELRETQWHQYNDAVDVSER